MTGEGSEGNDDFSERAVLSQGTPRDHCQGRVLPLSTHASTRSNTQSRFLKQNIITMYNQYSFLMDTYESNHKSIDKTKYRI